MVESSLSHPVLRCRGLPGMSSTIKSMLKGWVGEKESQLAMWLMLDDDIYKRFHNIIINTQNATTQIDHVVLSRYGIFVVETKNYKGWIYGSKDEPYWTQSLIGGIRNKFQNPLRQNYRHTMALAEHLKIDHGRIHSVVFFVGEAELKGDFPSNVMNEGVGSYIRSFKKILFISPDLARMEKQLRSLEEDKTVTAKEHVHNLQERYSSETVCPKCGRQLVKRVARVGPMAGSEFLGCSGYPQCRYIKK